MAMTTRRMQLLIAILFTSSAFGAESAFPEAESEHHEHAGVTDAAASTDGHEHGDADDHHESPDDDCHHHIMHCCCGHSHVSSLTRFVAPTSVGSISRMAIPLLSGRSTPSTTDLLHVPIA